ALRFLGKDFQIISEARAVLSDDIDVGSYKGTFGDKFRAHCEARRVVRKSLLDAQFGRYIQYALCLQPESACLLREPEDVGRCHNRKADYHHPRSLDFATSSRC